MNDHGPGCTGRQVLAAARRLMAHPNGVVAGQVVGDPGTVRGGQLMASDQGGRLHRLTGAADSAEVNFTYVARLVLREERDAGWAEGYADAMADQYEATRLAEAREKERVADS